MSHVIHTHRLQWVKLPWRTLCGGLLLGTLVGCAAAPGDSEKTELKESVASEKSQDSLSKSLDQPAIVVETVQIKPASQGTQPEGARKKEESLNETDKETQMTVLVLDDPELMARSAALEGGLAVPADQLDDGPRKPHRMRFHYGFDKHRLSDEDLAILRKHAGYLNAHPEARIHIHGHTDKFGSEDYNEFLSRLRASAAAKVLKNEGVRDTQITTSGWGSSRPLTRPEDHAANRRLELEYQAGQMAQAQ